MKIEWIGALQGAGCLKMDDDGSSVVKFTQDASQVHRIVHLVTCKGKLLKISVEIADD